MDKVLPKKDGQLNSVVLCWISWPSKMGLVGCAETFVTVYYCLLRNIPQQIWHDDLVMQALVRLSMARFRTIQFGTSYMNLRWSHTFKCRIHETPLSCIQINMVHTLQVCMSTSVIVIHYMGWGCQSPNSPGNTCFKWECCVWFAPCFSST